MYRPQSVTLTEHEWAVAEASGFGATQGLGRRPALLVIDVNHKFVGDPEEPILDAIRTWPTSCGGQGWLAIPGIQQCLRAFRDRQLPVFFTTGDDRAHSVAHGRWAGKNARVENTTESEVDGNHIRAEVEPQPGEVVLRKTKPSAFFGTALMSYLNELGVDSLIITGGTTSGCVRGTVVDAFSYNFKVAVVADGVFDRFTTSHEVSLFDLSLKYADILTAKSVQSYMRQLKIS